VGGLVKPESLEERAARVIGAPKLRRYGAVKEGRARIHVLGVDSPPHGRPRVRIALELPSGATSYVDIATSMIDEVLPLLEHAARAEGALDLDWLAER
jgi:hypothetical protein